MARGPKVKVSAAVLVAAVAVYFVTRPSRIESAPVVAVEPQAADGELAKTAGRATEAVQRTPVEAPAGGASAVAGTHVLRVVLEGIPDAAAAMTTVTLTGMDTRKESAVEIRPSWSCQGSTSEFDLDPFFAAVAERHEDLRVDELGVEIVHPQHLRENTWLPLSRGVKQENGQVVYEVRKRLVRPVYWPPLTLTVRDALTREHLHEVELHCVPMSLMNLWQRPGTSHYSPIGTDLSSPIALLGGRVPEDRGNVAGVALRPAASAAPELVQLSGRVATDRGVLVYARAPGYAWGRLVLDFSKGAERELLLGREAALSVRLANVQLERYAALETKAMLWVYKPGWGVGVVWAQRLDETLAADGLRLDGLEPGAYTVAVELGGRWSRKKRPVLAREELTLAAGESRELKLTLAAPAARAARATLGGVLSFPAFKGGKKVRLQLYAAGSGRSDDPDVELSLADLTPVGGALPTWLFRVEDLPVGRYQAKLSPFEASWIIELPAGGREDVELVTPELAEVIVDTVDARTGRRIPLDTIRYGRRGALPGRVSWRDTTARHEGERGRFRFWTVPGAAYVRTFNIPSGLDVGIRRKDVQLVAGRQSVRFELEPVHAIRIEFREGGVALPRDDHIWVAVRKGIRAVDHRGYVTANRLPSDRLVEVSAPGLYEVTFEGVGADRFGPLQPRRIYVRAGETAEMIVELRRK